MRVKTNGLRANGISAADGLFGRYFLGMRKPWAIAAFMQATLIASGCSPRVCDSGFELAADGNCYPEELGTDPEPDTDDVPDLDTDSGAVGDTSNDLDTGSDTGTAPPTNRKDDFSLEDLNPTSPRYGEAVSPRDYLQKVSGWYFLHAN